MRELTNPTTSAGGKIRMAREVVGQPAEALPALHYVRVVGYHVQNVVAIQLLYMHWF